MIEDDVHALAECMPQAQRPPWLAVSCPPLPIFLVGDFNARHPSWDPLVRDSITPPVTGRWIHKHLIAPTAHTLHPTLPRLTLINTCFTTSRYIATHTSPDGDTVIDLALTSHAQLVSCMDVLTGDVIASDHFPIMLTLHAPSSIPIPTAPHVIDPDLEHKYDSDHDEDRDAVCTLDLVVRTSTIPGSGLGLFARRAFKAGELIEEYTGEVLTEQQKKRHYPRNNAEYLVKVKRDMYIDAQDRLFPPLHVISIQPVRNITTQHLPSRTPVAATQTSEQHATSKQGRRYSSLMEQHTNNVHTQRHPSARISQRPRMLMFHLIQQATG